MKKLIYVFVAMLLIAACESKPTESDTYVKEVIDRTHEVYTYTFTEEDYQKAQQ